MRNESRRPIAALLVFTAMTLPACLDTSEPDAEVSSSDDQAVMLENGLTQNGLTQNGLTQNGLTQNGLTQNGLTQNGLLMTTLEEDPSARMLASYIASCALPAGMSITLPLSSGPLVLKGQMGLAPPWAVEDGICDESCQRWVSACVISRVNYLGHSIPLSLRGDHGALVTDAAERANYPLREAAYFGNIFKPIQEMYACTSPGSNLINRVCGPLGAENLDCVVSVLGDCADVCDGISSQDGNFQYCQGPAKGEAPYLQAITTFRQVTDEDHPQ
jgi:hypothetical protein